MRVVRGLWRILVGVKDALVLLFMLLFFALLYAALSVRPNPTLPAGSGALVIKLNGALVEQPADVDAFSLLSGDTGLARETRLRDVTRALHLAATDPQIKVVVLDLDSFTGGGQATIAAAGEAVDAVKKAGKPVVAYATGYLDDGYQLAAHAGEIWLNPLGAVLISGPGSQHLYYKGLLDKIGVTYNVYRVGTYKSAVEPFIRRDQSPEAKAANQALADSLFTAWTDEVGHARPKASLASYVRDPIAALDEGGGDSAEAARKAGLIDQLGDRYAFGRRVATWTGAGNDGPADYRAVSLNRYLAAHPEGEGGKVGVLTIAGTIVDGSGGPGSAAGETIARVLSQELAKKRIKALVVRVDSPGGSVTASERMRTAILEAKSQGLPVVVSMGSLAASGGYWVSTTGDTIFAEPSTITGSIGVFGLLPTFKGALAKLGLSADGVSTTPLSGQPDVFHGTSPEFDKLIQTGIENVYKRFTGLVAQARHMSPAQVDAIGQGHVWAGGTARQIGLVDRFGGLDEAIAFAAQQAKLSGADAQPRWIERQPSTWKGWLRDIVRGPDRDSNDGADAWTLYARRPQNLLLGALGVAKEVGTGPAIQIRCLECAPPPARVDGQQAVGLLSRLLR